MQFLNVNPERMDVIAELDLRRAGDGRPALRFPCWSAPIVVGDRLILRGTEHVICLRLKTIDS